jgi:hypothetical protein
MGPLDAIVMDNIFPGTSSVSLRPGCSNWLTDIPGIAKTLLVYNATSLNKLFISTTTNIYEATLGGVCGAAVTACTNGNWEFINLINAAGIGYLLAVNGVDNLKNYDGAAWVNVTGVSALAITGVATTKFSNISLHKRRVWFVEKNSMNLWYLASDAIAGVATVFPVGSLFRQGGSLLATASWTVDGGQGSEDYFVIVTSEGELAVYAGTDPNTAANWSLVGVYSLGQPIGKKCLIKYGGDLLYLSTQGLYPLSKLLLSATLDRNQAISYKIEQAFLDAAFSFKENSGWQPIIFPNADIVLVNIPVAPDTISYQYVMNNITKSWMRVTGWNASTWALMDNELYFSGGDKVSKAWAGFSDAGVPITGTVFQAYNNLRVAGQKNVSLVRPHIALEGNVTLRLSFDADYKVFPDSNFLDYAQLNLAGIWDTSLWDEALWGGDLGAIESRWITVPNIPGYLYSFRLQLTTSTARFLWTSTDIAFRRAGIL